LRATKAPTVSLSAVALNHITAMLLTLSVMVPAAAPAAPALAASALARRVVLPASVTPEHYRIDFTPDATALTFRGAVEIDVTVREPTDKIVFNSVDLVIDSAALSGSAQAPVISYDERRQTATLTTHQTLEPGGHTLKLRYHGKIYQQASGLFALDYDSAAAKGRALYTQFENVDARRFVPCWDEPARKATFELIATVPAEQMALSNMPVVSTETLPGGLKRVHFGVTPRMSPYLLFFAAGDFERVHRTVGGVDIGVVVTRGDAASAGFALDAAVDMLPYYNDYFATTYPLPKLDLVAGPGSSAIFGAMENWGAIFGFERDLLIDPRLSTEQDRRRVYEVIAHEMAHQWFGDLVTMQWWDDAWLNEGFATWMENKVPEHFHPAWHEWLQNMRAKQAAMQTDARDGTHPIITPIDDAMQADDAFDLITYDKGAQVIRTLETYLGEDEFRAGVRRYMHDHAYANAVTEDLWRELDKGSTRPIAPIAHDLTLQAGVPMINEISASCSDRMTTLQLAQGHFAIDADSTQARIWHVPVTAAAIDGPPAQAVIAGARAVAMQVSGCDAVILNAGQIAYFRSHYSSAGLAAITAHFADLATADQLGVLNDTASLAAVGIEPMAAFMNLTKHFPVKAGQEVAAALVGELQNLDLAYDGLPTQAAFRSYARAVLNPILARIGWDQQPGEADNVALLRSDLAMALGEFGDPTLLMRARLQYQRYRSDPSSLDASARDTALSLVALMADQETWDQLHAMVRSARSEIERQQLYRLLATPRDDALIRQALELAVSGEPPPTLVPGMIRQAAQRHPRLAFEFAASHWEPIAATLEPESRTFFLPSLLHTASDMKVLDELKRFAAAHIAPQARQEVRKAQASVRYRAHIRRNRLPAVDRWLQHEGAAR